ncbi:PAN domain containing protein 1 [Sarcoptes scabiei]|uniref:PAN domain containing protein 1 n=1 Tax=Sarcoptes scabiei TaxID=52283 RepID=A0A131ZSZ0_SARSC|nr:PAN domain containing protein 1 [Sarcoptes scabiei]
MLPVLLSVITRALVTSDNCFGGVETFEKLASSNFEPNTVPMAGVLLQQANVSLTRDCINLCRQQQRCTVFNLDYQQFQCSAFVESSRRHRDHLQPSKSTNLFEKICLKGLARQDFDQICGNERLWAFERVKDYFLDGFVDKELINMADREECAKACLTESSFICRSADFDEVKRVCRLSAENRRSQPQAFVYAKNSQRDYIENQCAPSAGPASCVYTTKSNTNVFSMDSLQFATSSDECQLQCDRELSFNCRSFGFINNRCMLSSDDEKSIGKQHPLFSLKGSIYGERTCVAELCTNGIFTYEKITGHLLRSAITTPVDLPEYSLLGLTNWCRESCDQAQLNCPAFSINYKNSRCERLDRNTQGRTADLIATEGESYFEKICLRVPQIMSQCQDKFWAFERVLGYELAPVLYIKTLNFVQSRRDCQEYCLQEREFPCRSALYNDETTECKLSQEDRRTSPGHYYRSRSMKINYLENQCVRIHSACPYQRTENAYPAYTDIVETNSVQSSNACEKLCNDNRYFLCRSYAYYPSNSQCFLSGDDSVSAGSSSIQHRSNIRQCSKLPNFDSNAMFDKTDHKIIEEEDDDLDHLDRDSHHLQHPDQFVGTVPDQSSSLSTSIDRIGETSTLTPPTSSRISPFYSPSSAFSPSSQMTSSGSMPTTLSTNGGISMSPSITTSNLNRNKGVVILNGTLGGIITTKTTRFPESLLPTITPPSRNLI